MPSSVSEGVRPSAARMRSYSSAVMLCVASICGVTVTGSGTTAAEELVIVDAFILAQGLRRGWEALCGRRASAARAARHVADKPKAMRYFGSGSPPEAGMAELADAADSKSAGPCGHGGSTPPPGTSLKQPLNHQLRKTQNRLSVTGGICAPGQMHWRSQP